MRGIYVLVSLSHSLQSLQACVQVHSPFRKFPQLWFVGWKLNPILSLLLAVSESLADARIRKKVSFSLSASVFVEKFV